jgi:hypothetical protein
LVGRKEEAKATSALPRGLKPRGFRRAKAQNCESFSAVRQQLEKEDQS